MAKVRGRSRDAAEDDDEERGGGETEGGADERGGEVIVEALHGWSLGYRKRRRKPVTTAVSGSGAHKGSEERSRRECTFHTPRRRLRVAGAIRANALRTNPRSGERRNGETSGGP